MKIAKILLIPSLLVTLATPVIAKELDKSSPKLYSSTPAGNALTAQNLSCVQTAVEKRDNAIIAAFDKFSVAAKSALEKRRDALKAAWALTDRKERKAAIVKAWADFKTAIRTARKNLNKERLDAWKQYRLDLKACRSQGAPVIDDLGSEGSEAQL